MKGVEGDRVDWKQRIVGRVKDFGGYGRWEGGGNGVGVDMGLGELHEIDVLG